VAEGGGLLNRYRVVKPYRGFESLRLRHLDLAAALPRRALWRNLDVVGQQSILAAAVHGRVGALEMPRK
jgi:hypothetical protein